MGLDMYLTATAHIGGEHGVEIEGLDDGGLEISGIKYNAGYWRKANAVHGWFVNHVQRGVDDCKPYMVERSDLERTAGFMRVYPEGSKPCRPAADRGLFLRFAGRGRLLLG
jgi:hypothetical protein